MQIRAGEADREMIAALGVDIRFLYTVVFALGAALAGFAGALIGALQSVQVGMGEPVLILAFVVIVIGGIGSIRGALVAALIVGLVDTMGRFLLPTCCRASWKPRPRAASARRSPRC
jgi:branched-chain amino acid transport system permease protein